MRVPRVAPERLALGVAACSVWAAAGVRLAGAIDLPTVRQLADAGPELAHAGVAVALTFAVMAVIPRASSRRRSIFRIPWGN